MVLVVVLSCLGSYGQVTDKEWQALIQVESEQGRTSSNVAQIRKLLIDDINRIFKEQKCERRYTYEDRNCPVKSRVIFDFYTDYYGGPSGYKRKHTSNYWRKVDKELKKIERHDTTSTN
jgi:hypothetical protein